MAEVTETPKRKRGRPRKCEAQPACPKPVDPEFDGKTDREIVEYIQGLEAKLSEAYSRVRGKANFAYVRLPQLPICGWWDRGNVMDELSEAKERLAEAKEAVRTLTEVLAQYPKAKVFFFTEEGLFDKLVDEGAVEPA